MAAPRELIVTHLGADFDAVGAMLGARRLFPNARLFFPGSKEESVRRMLAAQGADLLEVRQRDVLPGDLRRVVLCDIRQRGRIGVVAEWLEGRSDVEVVAYDHHTATDDDLEAAGGIVDPSVGATSTLMVEELARRGIDPEPLERDLLMAGIYEDTGSLAYDTTTPRDLAAAGRLLELGADLDLVRRHAVRQLDREHLEVLHRMARELEVHRVRGHRIGVVAIDLGRYIEELAPLVSRCFEIFDLDAVFALFGEGERVSLIARGQIESCDLGEVLAAIAEGGGHATAAGGSLKGVTILEARESLLAHLEAALPPRGTARELMVQPVSRLSAGLTIEEAKAELNRRHVNAAPVVDAASRVIGVATRQQLDAALAHRLGTRPVADVMVTELSWEAPDAPAEQAAQRILHGASRLILVGDPESRVVEGVITRMGVLRYLTGEAAQSTIGRGHEQTEVRRRRSGVEALLAALPAPLANQVETVRRLALEADTPVFLVGGLVRDLILDRENRDLDLVVEGDGPAFARRLAEALGGRVRVHEPFMTAVVVGPDGQHIDVATARSEFYRAPAALPEVQTSALRQDLYRRDFTINTLAVRLGPGRPPELLDYFGGLRDLEGRTLRVLHSLSFIDDPTRVLRAVRLEVRLGFQMSEETERLLTVALEEGVFDRLSGPRLRDEVRRLLDDPDTALKALDRIAELGMLGVLHPGLEREGRWRDHLRHAWGALEWARLEGLELVPFPAWRLLLIALTWELEDDAVRRLAHRWALAREDRSALTSGRTRLRGALEALAAEPVPSVAATRLESLSDDLLLLAVAMAGGTERDAVRRYLERDRLLELTISGDDLLRNGVAQGPEVGELLAATRAARLDGRIEATEELDFALRLARGNAPRAALAAEGPE